MARQDVKLAYVRADARLSTVLAQGHPWVYRDAIARAPVGLPTGAWVRVQCGKHQYYGLWDAESPIAVRIFSRKQRPNQAWVKARVREAWTLRSRLRQPQAHTSAYRWIYGAADGLPGMIVDLYGDETGDQQWAVVRQYSASVQLLRSWLISALTATIPLSGIIARSHTPGEYTLWHGADPLQPIIILENNLRFEVDVIQGQKTGFFLDQRQNRRTVGQISQGLRVLNLFSYTGGFSLYAARAGASHVVSVDNARPAMAAARRNFQLNGIDPAQHDFVVGDCFAVLADFYQAGRRFDLVIVDPPSFAHSKAQLDAALHAYRRLNTLAMQCLTPDGFLASSSCSSQAGPEAFKDMLAAAATTAGRRLRILHEAGHALDHPVLPAFPEGRYLKFVLARALPIF